jgi:hypothetical protein
MLRTTLQSLAILLLAPPLACVFAQEPSIDVIPRPAHVQQLNGARIGAKIRRPSQRTMNRSATKVTSSKHPMLACEFARTLPAGFFYARHNPRTAHRLRRNDPATAHHRPPRFPIAGLLLHSARHIQSVDYLKRP